MVLSREWQQKHAPTISPAEYLVVSAEVLMLAEDQLRLKLGIEVVTVLNIVGMLNRTLHNLGSSKQLDSSILNEVLASLMSDHDNTLSEKKLIQYFTFKRQLGEYYTELEGFIDFNQCHLPYALDFVFLGVSIERYWHIKEFEETEIAKLHSEYGCFHSDLVWRKGEVSAHLEKAKELIKKFKEVTKDI